MSQLPRIRLDPTRPGTGKWECTSVRADGHVKQGKGYTPIDAYRKWERCR